MSSEGETPLRLLFARLFLFSISLPPFSQSSSRARLISCSKYGWGPHVRRFYRSVYPGFFAVFFKDPNAFNKDTLFSWEYRQNSPRRAAKIPGDDLYVVPFFNMALDAVHNTSGASETIFMKFRSRNSRATGPKMRVPRGFKSLSIITMALLSKR